MCDGSKRNETTKGFKRGWRMAAAAAAPAPKNKVIQSGRGNKIQNHVSLTVLIFTEEQLSPNSSETKAQTSTSWGPLNLDSPLTRPFSNQTAAPSTWVQKRTPSVWHKNGTEWLVRTVETFGKPHGFILFLRSGNNRDKRPVDSGLQIYLRWQNGLKWDSHVAVFLPLRFVKI